MPEADVAEPALLLHHFDDLDQQRESSSLGMWIFLGTEVMFFGGLFLAYAVFRSTDPTAFAEASKHLDVMLGGINTVVLLTSSLTMALAVHAAQRGRRTAVVGYLLATILLGAAFLGIKAIEYYHDYQEHLIPGLNFSLAKFHGPYPVYDPRRAEMFFVIYFFMTGLHAIHLIVGIALLGIMAALVGRRWCSGGGESQIEVTGLYWHFIDIIWIFLYPLLYLIDVHK